MDVSFPDDILFLSVAASAKKSINEEYWIIFEKDEYIDVC